jgi:CBS domain-containing protein
MLKLSDIMTRSVMTFSPETTLRDASDALAARHLGGAPVVAGRKVVGVISMTDILDFQASMPPTPADRAVPMDWDAFDEHSSRRETEGDPAAIFFTELWNDERVELGTRFDQAPSPEGDPLAAYTVAEVMTRRVRALGPDADVEEAADVMQRLHIHRVLVMGGDELLGIVSTMDIASAVADHRFTVRRYVFDRHARGDDRGGAF